MDLHGRLCQSGRVEQEDQLFIVAIGGGDPALTVSFVQNRHVPLPVLGR